MAVKIKTIAEIDKAFDKLSGDANMRSLSAVLRMGAEQIERRGKLGFIKNLVIVTGVLSVALTLVVQFVPQKLKLQLQIWEYIFVALCVICVIILFRVRGTLEQYLEEEKRIRNMMIEASMKITKSPSFTPTPLAIELRGSLKDALRHCVTTPNDELVALAERDN
jgi:hypothetical protein